MFGHPFVDSTLFPPFPLPPPPHPPLSPSASPPQNLRDAANWLGYTYLFVRMLRSPAVYGVPLGAVEADPLLLDRRYNQRGGGGRRIWGVPLGAVEADPLLLDRR